MEEEEQSGGVRSDVEAADLLDPNPDILDLFRFYNDLYFDSKLHSCTVDWSARRMTLCAGNCTYGAGSCAIRLSEPLLKFRASVDVKETLLHEMIHAYLWLTNSNQDHDDHGPSFQTIMQAINDSQAMDHQRPTGGYHISIYHKFSDEVNSYRKHLWKCIHCGGLVKRATNRAPSPADCYQKIGRGNICSSERCHWHRHQQLCGGEYEKIAEPEGYRDRRLRARKTGIQPKETKIISEACLNNETSTKQKVAADSLGTKKTKSRGESKESFQLARNASLEVYFSSKSKVNDTEKPVTAIAIEANCELHGKNSSEEDSTEKLSKKRGRKYKSYDSDRDGFCSVDRKPAVALSKRHEVENSFDRLTVQKKECTVIIGWKGWYAYEGDEDDNETRALKNKRSQRRMFERASFQVMNVTDPVITADPPRMPEKNQDPVFLKKGIQSGKNNAVSENTLGPFTVCMGDSANSNVVGVIDAIPKQVLPVDDYSSSMLEGLSAACYAKIIDPVMCRQDEKFPHREWPVGAVSNSILEPECSFIGAPDSAKPTVLIDYSNFGTAEGSEPFLLNGSDLGMVKGKSQKFLEAEGLSTKVEVSKTKIPCEWRSKRRKEYPGRSNATIPRGEPSAVCPICEMVFYGNIEDASFNTKFNQHIDACMRESCLQ